MKNTEIGFMLLIVAGLMNSSFTLPMKFTRRWAWENTWLAWTVFALLLLPTAVAVCTVPELADVYRMAGGAQVATVMAFGAGWGLSQVLFGIAVETIGIALTFSLVLGTSAAVGALIPMLRLHPEKLGSPAGHTLLLGIGVVLLGVAICAVAGKLRESANHQPVAEHGSNGTAGLLLAILCGLGASLVNVGLAFGAPLIAMAIRHGASPTNAVNAVWLPVTLAGSIPNLLYCFYLLKKNSTCGKFKDGRLSYWTLALVMAIFWFGSTLLYGTSASLLGPLGAVLGWPLFMSLIVISASLLGIVTGEWKGSGRLPLAIQLAGVATLILAIFILSRASQTLA
jgi:L-rhamnose-H+ transport protein